MLCPNSVGVCFSPNAHQPSNMQISGGGDRWKCPACQLVITESQRTEMANYHAKLRGQKETPILDRGQTALAILQALVGKEPPSDRLPPAHKLVVDAVSLADGLMQQLANRQPTVLQNNRFEQQPNQVAYKDLAVGDRYRLPADLSDPENVWVKLTDYRCVCVTRMAQGDHTSRTVTLGSTHPDCLVTRV